MKSSPASSPGDWSDWVWQEKNNGALTFYLRMPQDSNKSTEFIHVRQSWKGAALMMLFPGESTWMVPRAARQVGESRAVGRHGFNGILGGLLTHSLIEFLGGWDAWVNPGYICLGPWALSAGSP